MNYTNPASRSSDADTDVLWQSPATSAPQLTTSHELTLGTKEKTDGVTGVDETTSGASQSLDGARISISSSAAQAQGVRFAELESLRAAGESIERLIAIFARLFEESIPSPVQRRPSTIGFLEASPNSQFNDPFEESA